MNDFVSGIVLYNPDMKRLRKNVDSILTTVDKIIMIDNGSENILEITNCYSNHKKVELIKNEENLGIAKALNQIMARGDILGYEWILLLDQDSISPANIISEYSKFINDNDAERIGILCPKILDLNSEKKVEKGNGFILVEKCITSGSLNSVSAWKEINGFDEIMFIDGVDHDYCIRLLRAQFTIYKINSVVLLHEIGNIKYKKIFRHSIESLNHSSFRKFYIARNIIYMDRKYHRYISIKTISRIAKQVFLVIFIEDDKKKKCKNILNGVKDGLSIKIIN